jgi:hypothetical protein
MVKKYLPSVKVVAADAVGSKIFDDEVYPWLQKGLGSGLRAEELDNLEEDVLDEVRLVGDQEAFTTARALARNEGLLAGGSAGCATFAALTISHGLPPGARIVTILPDRLERYLFEHASDAWMTEHGFDDDTRPEAVWQAVHTWRRQVRILHTPQGLPVYKKGKRRENGQVDKKDKVKESLSG